MATYQDAALAQKLIHRVASLNNQLVRTLADTMALRAELGAMTVTRQNEIRAAITDIGYNSVEIEAILARVAQINATAQAQGLAAVAEP